MSIISETVKIKWGTSNRKYYKEKGYIFTKYGDEFEVKVEDLTKGVDVKLDVKCDLCNKTIENITWFKYCKNIDKNKKYICKTCGSKNIKRIEKIQRSKLLKSKSFKEWCEENLSEQQCSEILDRWDYKLNKYKPNEVTYASAKKYFFKCPQNLHCSELKSISSFTHNYKNALECEKCNSFEQWCNNKLPKKEANEILSRWDYELNKCSPNQVSCYSDGIERKGYYFKCLKHPEHKSEIKHIRNFIRRSNTMYCNQCNSFAQWNIDRLGEDFVENIGNVKRTKTQILGKLKNPL